MQPIADYRPFGAFRLALAALVVAQHFLANCAPAEWVAAAAPYEVGSLAVLAFFALSGFVICEAADRIYPGRPVAFLANRLLRIAPHFLAAVVVTVALLAPLAATGPVRVDRAGLLDPALAFGTGNLVANALGFLPFANLAMRADLLPVAWAVRVEMIFYVLVAALLLAGRGRRLGLAPCGALLAALMLPPFVLAMLHKAPAFLQLSPYFVFGGALYVALSRRSRTAGAVAALALVLVAWEFGARPTHHPAIGFERAHVVQGLLLGSLLAAFTALAASRAGRWRDLDRALGDLSYPLYIWHGSAMLVGLAFGAEADATLLLPLAVLAVATAVLAHLVIDPAADRLRDLVRGRRLHAPPQATPAARVAAP